MTSTLPPHNATRIANSRTVTMRSTGFEPSTRLPSSSHRKVVLPAASLLSETAYLRMAPSCVPMYTRPPHVSSDLILPGTSLKNVTSSNTRIETSSPMIERSSDNNNKHSQTSTTPHQQTPRERESVVERVSVCCTTDASPTPSLSLANVPVSLETISEQVEGFNREHNTCTSIINDTETASPTSSEKGASSGGWLMQQAAGERMQHQRNNNKRRREARAKREKDRSYLDSNQGPCD